MAACTAPISAVYATAYIRRFGSLISKCAEPISAAFYKIINDEVIITGKAYVG